jgi:pimeloyl-ACP methyl ester carboxylesterase
MISTNFTRRQAPKPPPPRRAPQSHAISLPLSLKKTSKIKMGDSLPCLFCISSPLSLSQLSTLNTQNKKTKTQSHTAPFSERVNEVNVTFSKIKEIKMGDSLSCLLFQAPPRLNGDSSNRQSDSEIRNARSTGKEFIDSFGGDAQPVIWLFTRTSHRIPAVFTNANSEYTLLFSHGNAEDLERVAIWIRRLSRMLGVNTLAYDYPGYGLAGDRNPKESFCHGAAHAAYRYLTDVVGIKPNKIIFYGRSLGGSVSTHLAQEVTEEGCPPAGMIIQSAPLSAFRVVLRVKGGCSLPMDRLDTGRAVVNIGCPTLVIHGDQDSVVPFWHGEEIHRLIPAKYRLDPLWVRGAGHNDVEKIGFRSGALRERLRRFFHEDIRDVGRCQ